jgi:WD40 repeat protein
MMNNYNILTLGTSGSGKTIFLASLFKQLSTQGEKGFFVEVADSQKSRELNTIYTQIVTGEKWPAGTRNVTNWTFNCCVKNSELDNYPVCQFTYIDYAGGLLTDVDDDEDITFDFQEEVPKADAILVIIDGFKAYKFMEDKTLSNRDVLIWLQNDMPNIMQLVDKCKKDTPVHFIISKWDLLANRYKLSEILNRLQDKVKEFKDVVVSRKNAGCPLRIIPISSIGQEFATPQDDGSMRKNPDVIPIPFQVEIPLICVMIDKVKAYINSLEINKQEVYPSVQAKTNLLFSGNVLMDRVKTYVQSLGVDTDNIQALIQTKTNFALFDPLIQSFFNKEAAIILGDKEERLKEVKNDETALNYLVSIFLEHLQKFEKEFPEANLGGEIIFSSPKPPVKYARTTLSSATLTQTLIGHQKVVRSLCFTSDSQAIFSASHDKSIRFWQLASGKLQGTINETSGFVLANLSKDNQLLFTTSEDKIIKIWDANTGKCLHKWKGHSDLINAFVVSPDGRTFITGSRDKTVKLWQFGTDGGQLIHTLNGHRSFVYALAVSSDWRIAASGGGDKTVFLWELDKGKLLYTLDKHLGFIRALAFSSDGNILVSGGFGKTVYVWDWKVRNLCYELEGHTEAIISLAISSDNRILASGSEDCTIKLWDLSTGNLVTTLPGHMGRVTTLAFSLDNQILASGSEDNTIKIWKIV